MHASCRCEDAPKDRGFFGQGKAVWKDIKCGYRSSDGNTSGGEKMMALEIK